MPFTRAFSRIRAERFAEMLVAPAGRRRARWWWGENFRFGHGGAGTVEMLTQFGRSRALRVESPGIVTSDDGKPISSTRIRRLVATGQVDAVHPAARPPRTRWRGSSWAATAAAAAWACPPPTSRSRPTPPCRAGACTPPAPCSASGRSAAAVNIGVAPTFESLDPRPMRLEAFLLDHDGSDLYGQTMRIDFIERLRDERRFETTEALMAQVTQDIARTRELAAPHVDGNGNGALEPPG